MTTITLPRATVEQALEALEWIEPSGLTGRGGIEARNKAINNFRAALAQQAEPLNLSDPAIQKRLASQWGYVPAAQAEPVEPVAGVVLNKEGRAALVEYGREEWHCVVRNARRLYTAPPKDEPKPMHPELRKMWEDHFDKCFRAMPVPEQVEPVEPVATLIAQRDALLEVLKYLDKEFRQHGRRHWPEAVRVRAAIKAVEGEKT